MPYITSINAIGHWHYCHWPIMASGQPARALHVYDCYSAPPPGIYHHACDSQQTLTKLLGHNLINSTSQLTIQQ
jgi:hypothetical protein